MGFFSRWMSGLQFLCQHAAITFKFLFHPKEIFKSPEIRTKTQSRILRVFCTRLAAAALWKWNVAVTLSSLGQTFSSLPLVADYEQSALAEVVERSLLSLLLIPLVALVFLLVWKVS